jgi:3-deoxy-manno-octulosonate cytidylyltransferase (CMP-KDO synthetase)
MNRAVEHGYRVRIIEVKGRMIGVDVPEGIKYVEKVLSTDHLVKEYI